MPVIRSLTLVLCLFLAGCDSNHSYVDVIPDIPPDWITFQAESLLRFQGPPDLVKQDIIPIDSFVELYQGDRIWVSFDYGPYTRSTHTCPYGLPACQVLKVFIGGEKATLFILQLESPEPERGDLLYAVSAGFDDLGDKDRLAFSARSYSASDTFSLRQIVSSIEFRP